MRSPALKDRPAGMNGCLVPLAAFLVTFCWFVGAFRDPDQEAAVRRELEALRIAVAAYSLTIDELRR